MITRTLTWDQWHALQALDTPRQAPVLRDLFGMSSVPQNLQFELQQSAGDPEQTPTVRFDPPLPVYTTPDGGHTVRLGTETVSEDAVARQRRRLGYMQQAIKIAAEDPLVLDMFEQKIHEVLVYARLKGHDVQDWSDRP
jgi:hypothetical protein